MIRKTAITITLEHIEFDDRIVSANGFISRDLFSISDTRPTFYMIGSMGLASSIGLGVALKDSRKKVFVFDGDGNILMNLGSLVTIGSLKPKNLIHVVFDNNSHESTGNQPTNTSKINLEKLAKEAHYKIFVIKSKITLFSILKKIKNLNGPIFLLIKISTSKERSKRVSWKPKTIRDRVIKSL